MSFSLDLIFQTSNSVFKSGLRLKYYIQSAFSIPDEEKRAQEIRPFKKIDDSFKKIVITKDIVAPYYDENGILTMNIYDFLMDEKSLEK